MRLWSISPTYLDTKGLLAVWRESLLAKKVLEGKTKGYKHHPQLLRFREMSQPLLFINAYLSFIYTEALSRSYDFDKSKFTQVTLHEKIMVTTGQIAYELEHLKKKLENRAQDRVRQLPSINETIEVVPVFEVVEGEIQETAIWNKQRQHPME